MSDKVFGPGQDEEARAALREQDHRVLFDGRTVVVECVFCTIIDPIVLSERVRRACAGPLLRMTVGTMKRRQRDLAFVSKSFVNTDEPIEVVGERMKHVSPAPSRVEVELVRDRDAEKLWAEMHRSIDGGD